MIRAFSLLPVLLTSALRAADTKAPQAVLLEGLVSAAEKKLGTEVTKKEDWEKNKKRYRDELKDMLGLNPEPPRKDLKPVITGTLQAEGVVVEKLHFQSLPGLYVTANFYRPAQGGEKLPTILYFSGHGREISPDGRSNGNKAHYQHHGVWFARHGYNCLILDTVQWGEILGEHWGTYQLNRWWWISRGYTPAGVETWAGMRALDYLATRKEVDMAKIGVTGRSGGGAYSWFLTAVDDRVKVSAPTAGITTLRDHIMGGCIEGHCDCMYMVNYHGWDFDMVAALAAPRPLLISNTDKDTLFPLGGVIRVYENTRRIYKMLDAEKNIGLQIAEGPHEDTQPLYTGAFHWFERFLKDASALAVTSDGAVPLFKPEELRVFAELPADEINTRIDETFVPAFVPPPVPERSGQWSRLKDRWMKALREKAVKESVMKGGWLPFSLYPEGSPPSHHVLRRFALAGTAPDVVRASFSMAKVTTSSIGTVTASGEEAAFLLYTILLGDFAWGFEFHLDTPPSSHRMGPHFPGILKYFDMPQALAMAAERSKIRVTGRPEDWKWAVETAQKRGFGENLTVVPALETVEVKKIWDHAPHNAFTSLIKFKDAWYCTFREGSAHVPGTDGTVRVLTSPDGSTWTSAAEIAEAGADLRDPKFCLTNDGRLMLTIGASRYDGAPAPEAHRKLTGARSRVSFSPDGRSWSAPQPVCEENEWLWRVTLRPDNLPYHPAASSAPPALFFGVSYPVNVPWAQAKLSLWESPDGVNYTRIPGGIDPGKSLWLNETTLRFDDKGNMLALARSDRKNTNAYFGISRPPFKEWSWTDTGRVVHGPDFVRLKDGRMYYAGRDFTDGKPNTTVGMLFPSGSVMPLLTLPSGGDTSYPGIVEGPDGQLLVSYYSSHEGKTSIYLARLKIAK